ncbi:glycosyl hydrolase family 3 N terminal domain-containing protein [Suillus placidus]|uniref:Glycosyl hydrolase family 3 N terminal domain-containing protein n=1 Tax=Suillus placidus TaxID=48579 RepID=A0A9P7CY76_9AGAM|nr:glycosyl hydrolase family 3 N terminal domain-containing protein [Suillus placidus]
MENAVQSFLQVSGIPLANVARALMLRSANQDVKAIIQSEHLRQETLIFREIDLHFTASPEPPRANDRYRGVHGGRDEQELNAWHYQRSADIPTRILVDPVFASQVRSLSVYFVVSDVSHAGVSDSLSIKWVVLCFLPPLSSSFRISPPPTSKISESCSWGHEYVCHLTAELGEKYAIRQEGHNPEIDAIGFFMELEIVDRIASLMDANTFGRVYAWLNRCVTRLPPPDEVTFLRRIHKIYLQFSKFLEERQLGCDLILHFIVQAFQSFSEDLLTGFIAATYLEGVQKAAFNLHFCNGNEGNCMACDSILSDRTLREVYLMPFMLAQKYAMPWCFMISYNHANGAYISENKHLLHVILCSEWGFEGLVVSDWLDLEMPGTNKWRMLDLMNRSQDAETKWTLWLSRELFPNSSAHCSSQSLEGELGGAFELWGRGAFGSVLETRLIIESMQSKDVLKIRQMTTSCSAKILIPTQQGIREHLLIHHSNFQQDPDWQVFQALHTSDENIFIGAPTGSGKTICAEFVLLCLWSKREQPRAVCIEPYQEMVDQRVVEWHRKFSGLQGSKEIVGLTGDTSADLRLLEKGNVIVCTLSQWDILSRRWRQHKNVQNIGLLIADETQLVGGEVGPTYEVVIYRTRYVSAQTEVKTRIVPCGVSLANARDLGEWMGAPSHAIFNFSSRLQCRLTFDDLLIYCGADSNPDRFLNIEEANLQPHFDHINDKGLVESLKHGIGYYHEALDKQDKRIVERLFQSGAIQVLVESKAYTLSLKERMKLKGLLKVVASSAELESIPIRRHEDTILCRIYNRVPVKLDHADFEAPHFKTFLLLQAHVTRIHGSVTLASSDPFDNPIIDPALLESPFNLYVMVEAIKTAKRFAEASAWKGNIIQAVGALNSTTDEDLASYAQNSTSAVFHPVGTARMTSYSNKDSVVNPDLLVKGCSGL